MRKKITLCLMGCPHCGKDITIVYTKKALKKILKAVAFSDDVVIEISATVDADGAVLYHVPGEL